MNKRSLPFGLAPHEVGFLVLLGAAFYFAVPELGRWPWRCLVFIAAVVAAVPVLVWRCREEWRQLPNRAFFLILAAVWVVLFSFLGNTTVHYLDSPSLLVWMWGVFTSPLLDEGHGLLIPFVVLALYWWKRKDLVAQPAGLWWPSLGIVAFALLLHLLGFLAQQQRLSVIGLLLGLYGLTGLAWGRYWLKASFFPFFLLAFCVPIGEFAVPLTMPLRLLVARIVEIISHLGLAPDLLRSGTQLFDSEHTFGYEVAPACSGIRSLVALTALSTIYGFIVFKAPWKRMVMMLVALPLAILGNVVRLCFTIAVAELFGQAGGKAVETNAGYITFLVALTCTYGTARWLERVGVPPSPPSKTSGTQSEPPSGVERPATP